MGPAAARAPARPSAQRWARSRPRGRRTRANPASAVTCRAQNSVGVHALVFAGDWSPDSCTRAVKGAKDAGFDMIEVPVMDPPSVDTGMTKSVLQEYDMLASASLGLTPDADINSEDGEVVRRGVDLLDQALTATHEFGGSHMVGVIMSALRKYPGPCSPAARKNVVQSLKTIAAKAEDLGVTLGVEVVNRYETNVCNTARQAMELLADVDAAALRVHLDTYHMNIEEFSMADAVRTCGDKLGYVHIGEAHRGYLGSGSVDFEGLFRTLVGTGYKGPITFESFSAAVVSKDLSNALCVWRNLWEDGDDLAAHARQFIYGQLRAAEQGLRYS